MAICTWCNREMRDTVSCSITELHHYGEPVAMIPWGAEPGWRVTRRCGDCGAPPGGYHHPGCDVQRCPLCRGQMMSCGCRFDEDGLGEVFLDGNGNFAEVVNLGFDEVVVHHVDLPEKDITTLRGIPVTTPVRTMIDIAPDLDTDALDATVRDCLDRGLFTVEEAMARIDEGDMEDCRGAALLRASLGRV